MVVLVDAICVYCGKDQCGQGQDAKVWYCDMSGSVKSSACDVARRWEAHHYVCEAKLVLTR